MQTEHYKARLQEELSTVESELKALGRRNPKNPSDWVATKPDTQEDNADENVAADAVEQYDDNIAILDNLEVRYNELKAALERIEQGTYGKCGVCGADIEEDRLEANPAAATCKAHM